MPPIEFMVATVYAPDYNWTSARVKIMPPDGDDPWTLFVVHNRSLEVLAVHPLSVAPHVERGQLLLVDADGTDILVDLVGCSACHPTTRRDKEQV